MKHKFKINKTLSLFVLTIFSGLLSVQAQIWNAPALKGSTLTTGSTYYVYNVGSNGFLNRGGWWATQAALTALPTANASTIVIKWTAVNTSGSEWTFQYNSNNSNVDNNFLFPSLPNSSIGDVFTDNSVDDTWSVVQTDAANKIYSIQIANSYGGYVSTQFLGSEVAPETTNSGICNTVRYNRTSSNFTQWKFISQGDYDLYNAKVTLDRYLNYAKTKGGIDLTSYIATYNSDVTADINTASTGLLTALGRIDVSSSVLNSGFESGLTDWTNTGDFVTNDWTTPIGFSRNGILIEKWIGGPSNLGVGELTQTISGLANGLYGVTLNASAVQQGGSNPLHTGAFVLCGNKSTEVNGSGQFFVDKVLITNGILTIGCSLQGTVACSWTTFDDFKLYYYGPVITTSVSSLTYDDVYNSSTFTVAGLNLTNDISITAPSGITVSPTTIAANATNATVTVSYDGSTTVNANITLTSGARAANVSVKASSNIGCFTPAYATGNMIADPTFSAANLAAGGYVGWGPPEIVNKNAYCGRGTAYIRGSCWPNGGSIERALNTANGTALKPVKTYRLRAMINSKASPATYFQFQIEGVNGGDNIFINLPNTNGWKQIDTTFTTGATVTEHGIYFNSCTAASPAITDTCFIDNWEMYEVPVSTWSGIGNWSDVTKWDNLPVTGSDININTGEITVDQNALIKNIDVQPGCKLTVALNNALTANALTLNSDVSGTATFVNNGVVAITNAIVKQHLTFGRNWYISIPVTSVDSSALSVAANAIMMYDEPTASWKSPTTATLSPLKGYISTSTKTTGAVTFSGTLNDGTKTATLTRTFGAVKSGFNLVGNPYPSYLNWDAAIKSNIETTIWYRTKNAGNTAYIFDTYNAVSQIGTGLNGEAVNSNIPPMQAFWVRVKAPVLAHDTIGTLTFNNTMRAHKGSQTANSVTTPDVKFKALAVQNIAQQVLRLQVSNGVNSDETIVLFNANASNGFDDYDSPKMTNANAAVPEIYTQLGSDRMVINGLNSIETVNEIPLGFTTGQANNFTIKASELTNFDPSVQIILRDNLDVKEHILSLEREYVFNSGISSSINRFTLIFKTTAISTSNKNVTDNLLITTNNHQLIIKLPQSDNSAMVSVKNIIGQQLIQKMLTGTNTVLDLQKGTYLVAVTVLGITKTQKVSLN